MTAALAAVLDDTESNRVRGVSISVDPKNDTPAELLKYARRFDADPAQWLFLTEPGDDYMKIAAGFKVLAAPAEGTRPIFHSEKFFLVDGAGKVRGIYSHNSQEEMNQLTTDIGRLLGE
jgi:protein SCO1/2